MKRVLSEDQKQRKKEQQQRWAEKNRERLAADAREWYQQNKQHVRERNWLKTYGISSEEYRALLAAQNGRCAICRTTEPGKGEFFAVDHDHLSGAIRGLLCVHCNVGLGHFKDSPDLLADAIGYLRGPRGT